MSLGVARNSTMAVLVVLAGVLGGMKYAYGLINSSSRAHDICASEMLNCYFEHLVELRPIGDICFLEYCDCAG